MTRKEKEILSTIAHYEIASGVAKNIPEMRELLPVFKSAFTPKAQRLMDSYHKIKNTALDNLAAEFEKKNDGKKADFSSLEKK